MHVVIIFVLRLDVVVLDFFVFVDDAAHGGEWVWAGSGRVVMKGDYSG